MADTGSSEMSPGFAAFVTAFLGAGVAAVGVVLTLFVWILGGALLVLGVGLLIVSPVVFVVLRRRSRSEGPPTSSS